MVVLCIILILYEREWRLNKMRIDILTLFPGMFAAITEESIIARARNNGLIEINLHQIRDFTENRQRQVDDYPYGGGMGCVIQAQPIHSCWEYVSGQLRGKTRTMYLSPQGKVFTQEDARRLSRDYDNLILVCGHYEGIDQRFIDCCVDEEISIGDFVLTGGEIPAMAVTDSVCRLLPGVLSDEECFTEESHWAGLLEYPQYSRPEDWRGLKVPEVLISGNHQDIKKWRRKQSLKRTLLSRPDMFKKLLFDKTDLRLLDELKSEEQGPEAEQLLGGLHTGRITVRKSIQNDLERIIALKRKLNPEINSGITLEGLRENGEHFSIYADSLGFCGQAGYTLMDSHAELFIYLFPHCRGKGIGGYAMQTVIRDAFTKTNTCSLPKGEHERHIWDRLNFKFTQNSPPLLTVNTILK